MASLLSPVLLLTKEVSLWGAQWEQVGGPRAMSAPYGYVLQFYLMPSTG